jgi:hypothetical protein
MILTINDDHHHRCRHRHHHHHHPNHRHGTVQNYLKFLSSTLQPLNNE